MSIQKCPHGTYDILQQAKADAATAGGTRSFEHGGNESCGGEEREEETRLFTGGRETSEAV